MKKIITASFLLLILASVSCRGIQTPPPEKSDGKNYPVQTEPAPIQSQEQAAYPLGTAADTAGSDASFELQFAKNFTLSYRDGYKVLTVSQPWAGAEQSFTYLLIPRGAQPPAETNGALVIEVPVRSFVAMSTTYYPFLENIGKLENLVGADDVTYTYNESVRARAEAGELAIVGGGAGGGSVNIETLIELAPDLIMTSASGSTELDAHPRLLEAGLPVAINADYLEQSPLGRAEWGIFIAAFFDLENEAQAQFDALVKRYQTAVSLAAQVSERVTVFTNTDYQGSWYMPGGESYVALLLKDAGADYLWSEMAGSGALPLSFEQVFETAQQADYWINVGFAGDLASLLAMDSRYGEFEAFKDGHVFNYNARISPTGGLDYFESGVANPDLVLQDLIKIFYPDLLPDYELTYYQPLR